MIKPIVAVDMDEVLFPFIRDFTVFHNQTYGTNFSEADFKHDKYEQVLNASAQELMERIVVFRDAGGVLSSGPLDGAQRSLERLKEAYDLIVVTARFKDLEADTRRWLDMNLPNIFTKVVFSGNWDPHASYAQTKAQVCKSAGARVLIDDSLRHLSDCAELGIEGILFGSYPWNQTAALPPGVKRAMDWPHVEGLLKVKLHATNR